MKYTIILCLICLIVGVYIGYKVSPRPEIPLPAIVVDTQYVYVQLPGLPVIDLDVSFHTDFYVVNDSLSIAGDIYYTDVELKTVDETSSVKFRSLFHLDSQRFYFTDVAFNIKETIITKETTYVVKEKPRFLVEGGTTVNKNPEIFGKIGYVRNRLVYSAGYTNRDSFLVSLGYLF